MAGLFCTLVNRSVFEASSFHGGLLANTFWWAGVRSCSGVAGNVTWLKKWGRRDMKRRKLVAEYADERLRLRLIKKSKLLPSIVAQKAKSDLARLPLDSNICRVHNRCTITDRPRGLVTQYKVCRHKFKGYADAGLIPGLKRSTW